MRRNIFDIASQNTTMASEVGRLITMATKEDTICVNTYGDKTLFEYFDEYCFEDWMQRGHFVDLDDFLKCIGFDDLKRSATEDVEEFLTLIELIYNVWVLVNVDVANYDKVGYKLEWEGNYYHLKKVMDDILGQYNYTAYVDKKSEKVLVIENTPGVTAVAEIVEPSLALEVIKYNHYALKGETELKKSILLKMAQQLEPQRKSLHAIDSKLEDNIFFMFNNLDLRHNNRSANDKSYKEYVAKMKKRDLEKWYDELYQMVLVAFLLLDNVDRTEKVKELKGKITGGTN